MFLRLTWYFMQLSTFIFASIEYSITCTYTHLFIHSSVCRQLGSVLFVVKNLPAPYAEFLWCVPGEELPGTVFCFSYNTLSSEESCWSVCFFASCLSLPLLHSVCPAVVAIVPALGDHVGSRPAMHVKTSAPNPDDWFFQADPPGSTNSPFW